MSPSVSMVRPSKERDVKSQTLKGCAPCFKCGVSVTVGALYLGERNLKRDLTQTGMQVQAYPICPIL